MQCQLKTHAFDDQTIHALFVADICTWSKHAKPKCVQKKLENCFEVWSTTQNTSSPLIYRLLDFHDISYYGLFICTINKVITIKCMELYVQVIYSTNVLKKLIGFLSKLEQFSFEVL